MSFATFQLYLQALHDALSSEKLEKAHEMWMKALRTSRRPENAQALLCQRMSELAEKDFSKSPEEAEVRVAEACDALFEAYPNGAGAMYIANVMTGLMNDAERFDRACFWARNALDLSMKAGMEGRREEAVARMHYGNMLAQMAKYEEAVPQLQRAGELARKYEGQQSELMAVVFSLLGNAYKELGRFDEAEEVLRQELVLREDQKIGSPVELFVCLGHLGEVLAGKNDLASAIVVIEHAIEVFQESGSDLVAVGMLRLQLAKMWQMRGDLARSAEEMKVARAIFERHGLADDIEKIDEKLNELEGRRVE